MPCKVAGRATVTTKGLEGAAPASEAVMVPPFGTPELPSVALSEDSSVVPYLRERLPADTPSAAAAAAFTAKTVVLPSAATLMVEP